MRRPRSFPTLLAGLALLVGLPVALPAEAASPAARESPAAAPSRAETAETAAERPFGAECRTRVDGSHVVAYCHNPYPETDRVSLHIECERWWDIDTDSARVATGPAMTVQLSGRCWKEIGSAWVSHTR
ncbi:hypothetical protein ACFQVC_21155 [Streptomyces monticola]|uniref:Secreted protein n=1 Tax=Streptomyces monticola TaxID=2666263 RepID=A0ABW2JME0_9ACTN